MPPGDRGEFTALDVYNQLVYVDPTSRVTIGKLSANRAYATTAEETTNRDEESGWYVKTDRTGLRVGRAKLVPRLLRGLRRPPIFDQEAP